jgi:hypothetical protein
MVSVSDPGGRVHVVNHSREQGRVQDDFRNCVTDLLSAIGDKESV